MEICRLYSAEDVIHFKTPASCRHVSYPVSHPSGDSRLQRNLTIQRIVVIPSLLGRVLGGRVLEALDPVDGPEIGGEGGVANVLVRHVEVTLVTPP